jgi:hypothetical protein
MTGLQVTLDRPAVLFQQSVPLRIVYTNDDRARPFPLDPGSLDILTVTLFDAAGEAMASSNPIVRDGRAGLDAPLDAPGKIATTTIPPHETAEWTEDLLVYLDVPEPGAYSVGVRFRFGDIDVTSDRAPLEVMPLACAAVDALRDRTADNVLHVLTEHRGEAAATLFEFRSAHAPSQRWSGVAIDDAPVAATGVIAQTDFATTASFEHDYQRWLAWAEPEALTVALVRGAGLIVRERIEGVTGAGVFGRPLQHEDGGVTVLLRTARDALTAVRIDAEGRVSDRTSIELTESARGRALAFGVVPREGLTWVTSPPLSLHTLDGRGAIRSRVLHEELKPFAAQLETKPIAKIEPPSIAVAGAVRHEQSLAFWTARATLDDDEWRRAEWVVGHDLLPPEERLVQVCVIPALQETTAVAVTETGRAVHLPPGAPARALQSIDPALARYARLAATTRTIDWIAADRNRGVIVTPLLKIRRGP